MTKNHFGLFLYKAFLAPWQDKERAKVLAAGILGSFASGAQALVINYGFAGAGLGVTAPFQIMRQGFFALIGVPLTLWLLSRMQARAKILGLQVLGLLLLSLGAINAFVPAVGYLLVAGPFWSLYGVRFALRQSDANKGNETALSSFLLILSAAMGFVVGGFFMDRGFDQAVLTGGTFGMLVGGQLLFLKRKQKLDFSLMRRFVRWRSPSVRFSVFSGVLNTLLEVSMPIWFRVIGLSAGAAGSLLAMRVVLTFLLTPVVGHIIQKSAFRAGMLGGTLLVGGWGLLLIAKDHPAWMMPALVCLAIASNLMNPAEVIRWFKRRSPEAIAVREAMMAAGRCPSFLLALPIVYNAPAIFPFVGLALTLIFLLFLGRGVGPNRFRA